MARQDALREYARLEAEISRLRTTAETETQVARQVELNLAMQERRVEMAAVKKTMRLQINVRDRNDKAL